MEELQQFYKNALVGSLCEPLCDEYRDKWRVCGTDKEKLITLSLRQQSIPYFSTYCNKGKGLSKEYLMREFEKYINGYTIRDADDVKGYTYGLYVGYDYDNGVELDKDVVHIMWSEDMEIVARKTKCPTIYVSNDSDVHIVCDGYNNVRVYLFDDSHVTIDDADETCSVIVYKYSDRCSVERGKFAFCEVKEFRKELKL